MPVDVESWVLPQTGTMVDLSPVVNPPVLKGLKIYPENPLQFDFILDRGDLVETPLMAD
ncbi:MAG: hypothetical protein HQL13_06575 [Candidatus Omnitrophica bacterium]|nr:hypothetical protein [Candidatus Omnitrophota bacterium]